MEKLLLLPSLSKIEQLELAKLAQQGDQTAKDRLVMSCSRLVKQRITKLVNENTWCYPQLNLIYEDLLNSGISGVLRAFETFDVSRNTSFSSYAFFWIDAFLQKQLVLIRKTSYSLSLDALDETVVDDTNEAKFDAVFNKFLCRQLLAVLETREREIIVLFFGLDCRRHTLKEIGAKFGFSFQYAGKVKKRALQKMRNSYKYMLKCA
ncbi:MAG: sigma-70 family RNA polymerase sigma factor [Oscillospiraceae bacterium]|nr:sigma-70 family RNA polymerase sigma factor [Oscillospiraceae bacterium]